MTREAAPGWPPEVVPELIDEGHDGELDARPHDEVDPFLDDIVDDAGFAEPQTANIVVPIGIVEAIRAAPAGTEILSTAIDLAVWVAGKNVAYGNSALKPIRIVSKANATEQIKVRIDDKLNRLIQGREYVGDNDLKDLLGYLLLFFVAEGMND